MHNDAAKQFDRYLQVAIHNKNGQGLLHFSNAFFVFLCFMSQSTIKMDKGAQHVFLLLITEKIVAIHNKNGQGLLHTAKVQSIFVTF